MTDLDQSGYDEFDRLSALVRRTRELLDTLLAEGALPEQGRDYLAGATLPHLERVEAGFRGWLRSDQADLAELRFLIMQAGELRTAPAKDAAERRAATSEALVEAGRAGGLSLVGSERAAWDLLGLAHARLVLAMLPRLPDGSVRYPAGRRTYADIPVPRGPAELAGRIEELERQLWRSASGRPARPLDPAFRRTYGFFDVAERLGRRAFGLA